VTDTRVVDNDGASRFEIVVDGGPAGRVDYRRRGSTIELAHTEIDPKFEGRGLGSVLVRGALDAARSGGLAVLPYCPFVRRYIDRHREYLDLVPAGERSRFALPA
jgi:uncharacterized protein